MEEQRIMAAYSCNTVRELVNAANKMGIKQEDIVTILHRDAQYWLIYYK